MNKWIAAAALALTGSTALAAPVTISATGHVLATDTNDGIFGTPFTGAVSVGTPINVSWTFDLDLFGADGNSDPNVGVYTGGGISSLVQVGNDVFQAPSLSLGVLPGAAGAGLTTYSFAFTGLGDIPAQLSWLFAVNFEVANADPTDAKPASLNAADFQNLRLQYQIQQGFDPGTARFDAFVASATPVPLPAGVWLLLGGLGALAPFRKRRKVEA